MASKIILTLPRGQKMPALGLGTFEVRDEEEITRAVETALEAGYRHIDTAYLYDNERVIGKVINQWISSGKLKREDLFITTKLPLIGIHPDRVELFMKKSLDNLQLSYVDLYLVHFPVGLKYREDNPLPFYVEDGVVVTEGATDHAALWQKMEEQVRAGRAKNIGLSNYNTEQIATVLKSAKIKPANLQVELHVYLQQKKLVDFCRKNGISIVAHTPLANPGFNKVLERLGQPPKELPDVLGDPTITKLAQKYSKSPAQIVLRFLLQYGVGVIPKSVTPSRINENIDLFDFELSDGDMKALYELEVGEDARIADFKAIRGIENHPDYPMK